MSWKICHFTDGTQPNNYLRDGSGYGGTIFKISPKIPHTFTVLYSFSTGGTGGIEPRAGLFLAQDGNYYGTTGFSAADRVGGTIFQMSPGGQVSFLYSFPAFVIPNSSLIQDKNGNFYGTTISGGTYDGGVVFMMTPTFTVTILRSFGQGNDGVNPDGLVFGPNGNLYGVTYIGWTNQVGSVFELSSDGTSYTVLHNFGDGSVPNDGDGPNGPLFLGSDNSLYGTTQDGGSAGLGTVFKISP